MIATELVEEIRRLLAEDKLSQRKIAHQLGVSRGTVGAIATGRRPDYEALSALAADQPGTPGPAARCPTCGGKVYLPCRACRVRRIKRNTRASTWQDSQAPLIDLDLKDEHRRRYETVRACRELGIPITESTENPS